MTSSAGIALYVYYLAKTHEGRTPPLAIASEVSPWQCDVAMDLQSYLKTLQTKDIFLIRGSDQVTPVLKDLRCSSDFFAGCWGPRLFRATNWTVLHGAGTHRDQWPGGIEKECAVNIHRTLSIC